MFGKENPGCPLWRAPCRREKCDWWARVQMKHPQEENARWHEGCAVVMNVMLQMHTGQMVMHNTASTDKVANEIKKASDEAAVRDVHIINGIKASFPVLHYLNDQQGMVEDRRDGDERER